MGKNVRKPQKSRLADMTIKPPPDPCYELPPAEECDEFTWPVLLPSPGHRLVARLMMHREHIVDFAITQVVQEEGNWLRIAKIDCHGGKIHRHQYTRDGRDIWDHRLIRVIPPGGIDVVEEGYANALDTMEK